MKKPKDRLLPGSKTFSFGNRDGRTPQRAPVSYQRVLDAAKKIKADQKKK